MSFLALAKRHGNAVTSLEVCRQLNCNVSVSEIQILNKRQFALPFVTEYFNIVFQYNNNEMYAVQYSNNINMKALSICVFYEKFTLISNLVYLFCCCILMDLISL